VAGGGQGRHRDGVSAGESRLVHAAAGDRDRGLPSSTGQPALRDLQYLITDGQSFFHEEQRDLVSDVLRLDRNALGYQVHSVPVGSAYSIDKEIITDPQLACILLRTTLIGFDNLRIFALCARIFNSAAGGNNARAVDVGGAVCSRRRRRTLAAARRDRSVHGDVLRLRRRERRLDRPRRQFPNGLDVRRRTRWQRSVDR